MAEALAPHESDSPFPIGPQPGVSYPLKVQYCGECSLPIEYCDFGASSEACKAWLQANLPDTFAELHVDAAGDGEGEQAEEGKKSKKRGGKGTKKAKAKGSEAEPHITLARSNRGKNKSVTVVKGMKTSGIDPKVASKFFSKKFAASSSVTGDDEIVILGDVKDELLDIIPEQWPQIPEECIDDLGEQKR